MLLGFVSDVGALVGKVALFFAVVANWLAVARIFSVVVGSLSLRAIRREVSFFSAAEAGKLPSLRLFRFVLLLVLVFAVIGAVAGLFAMIANHPFPLDWRTRLVESRRLFPLVLPVGAIVEEMPWFSAAKTYNTAYVGSSIRLVVIVGLIALFCSVFHLDLSQIFVVVHRLPDFLEPAILHPLKVIKDGRDFEKGFLCGLFEGKTALGDAVHALLHDPPNVAVLQLDSQLLVGDDQRGSQVGGLEGVAVLDCVLAGLDGLDMLVDGAVSADLVLLHLRDEVGFGQIARRLGLALPQLKRCLEVLGNLAWELALDPLLKRINLEVVLFLDH